MIIRTLCLVALLATAAPALAHEAKGPNGGRVADAGEYHVELVARGPAVELFITDQKDAPVPPAGFKAVAILTVGGKRVRVELAPAADARLAGRADAPMPAEPKGAVLLTAPSGKTAQARFN